MRRASHAIAVVAFALVMSFGVAAASCTRPVNSEHGLRSAVVVADEAVATPHTPTPHQVAVFLAAYHKAKMHDALVHKMKVRAFMEAWLRAVAAQQHHAATVSPAPTPAPSPTPTPVTSSERTIGEGVPCDGDLTPCWRVQIESGGTWNAFNPTGCGGAACYGPYQFSGEWANKLGLPADLATTTHEQWVVADRALWANGAGCGNWDAC